MVPTKFFNGDSKKITKFVKFICQVLKIFKNLKIHSTK